MLLNSALLNAAILNDFGGSSGGGGGGGGGFGGSNTRFVNGLDVELITGAAGYAVFFRAKIADAAGTVYDYSRRNNIDWCHSCSYDETVDAPIAQATVKLWREVGGRSLAPLRTDSSYNQTPFVEADLTLGTGPAIDIGRRIIIETASVPLGTAMLSIDDSDWHSVFEGFVTQIDWSQNPIVLECRDKGSALQSIWFPVPNTIIPSPANIQGALVELIDLAHTDTFTPLYVPVAPDPEVVVGTFTYAIEPAMDALQRIVEINAWDLRYRFVDLYQEFRLTFKDPGRGKTDADYVLTPAMYIDVTTMKLDVDTIRNDVTISYRPNNDTDVARVSINRYNPESVRRYGRRSMVLQEADDSPINTDFNAGLMADTIVFDLAQPMADKTIDMPYAWFFELNNLVRFTANRVHADNVLDLFVVGIKHVLEENRTRTQLTLRGTPGSYYRWLGRRPITPGGTAPSDPSGDPPPSAGFGTLQQTPNYSTDHVQLDWGWNGDPTATFDVYSQFGASGFNLAGSTIAGVNTLDFDTATDIEPFDPVTPQVPVIITFYVVASVSGVVVSTSPQCVASYGFGSP